MTDDYRGRNAIAFDEGADLRKAIEEISDSRRYGNWSRNDKIIELWDVNWFDRRGSRVSKVWLERLRRTLRETGTLDLDDLTEIASLTYAQLNRCVFSDDVLKCVETQVRKRMDWLKLYGQLTAAQRKMLLSEAGLAYSDISEEQQKAAMKILVGANAQALQGLDLASVDARVICSRRKRGRQFVYTIRARTNIGDFQDQVVFTTPIYTPPPKPEAMGGQGQGR